MLKLSLKLRVTWSSGTYLECNISLGIFRSWKLFLINHFPTLWPKVGRDHFALVSVGFRGNNLSETYLIYSPIMKNTERWNSFFPPQYILNIKTTIPEDWGGGRLKAPSDMFSGKLFKMSHTVRNSQITSII